MFRVMIQYNGTYIDLSGWLSLQTPLSYLDQFKDLDYTLEFKK